MRLLQLLSVLCLFLFSSQYSFSQDYSKMPAAVQQKMDQNKIEGKDALNGIIKKHTIEFESCGSLEKANATLASLNNYTDIVRWEFLSPGKIQVVVKPYFTNASLKQVLTELQLTFNFVSETYFVA